MQSELIRSAVDVVNKPINVASVSAGSIGTGLGAYFEVLSPLVGLLAALAGLTLSVMLAIKTYYGIQLTKKQLESIDGAEE